MFKKLICAVTFVGLTACGGGGGGADQQQDTSVSVPTGLIASGTSSSQVGVSWAKQPNAKSYVVYYSTTSPVTKSATKSKPVDSIYSGINFYGASSGTTYYFAVSASTNIDGSSDSALSAEVSATTLPSTPSITVEPQNTQAQVSWDAQVGTTYKIYHSSSSSFTKQNGLATIETSSTSPVTITSLVNGQLHYFAATATVGGVEGELSSIQAVVPDAALASSVAPSAPQLFSARCIFPGQPTFNWAKQAAVTAYRIYHSATNPVVTTDAYYAVSTNTNTYTLFPFGEKLSGTNYFVITALNGGVESAPSAQISCP
jgi:hypothetical protein